MYRRCNRSVFVSRGVRPGEFLLSIIPTLLLRRRPKFLRGNWATTSSKSVASTATNLSFDCGSAKPAAKDRPPRSSLAAYLIGLSAPPISATSESRPSPVAVGQTSPKASTMPFGELKSFVVYNASSWTSGKTSAGLGSLSPLWAICVRTAGNRLQQLDSSCGCQNGYRNEVSRASSISRNQSGNCS